MKVFEILRNDVKSVTATQVEEKLKGFDWKYEFSDDVTRYAVGHRELELIENLVYRLWKTDEPAALNLWWKYSGGNPHGDVTIVPSFIIRLQEQDRDSTRETQSS